MPAKSPLKLKSSINTIGMLLITAVPVFLIAKLLLSVSCDGINCLKFKDISKYKEDEIYQSDKNSFRGLYKNGVEKFRIDAEPKIKKENAQEETEIMITKMKKLYEKERSPYPGEISDSVVCADEFIPKWNKKEVNGLTINYTTAFLNDRLVYGACTDEQLKYKSLLLAFYCPRQEKLYQLEFISDKTTFDDKYYTEVLNSISCK